MTTTKRARHPYWFELDGDVFNIDPKTWQILFEDYAHVWAMVTAKELADGSRRLLPRFISHSTGEIFNVSKDTLKYCKTWTVAKTQRLRSMGYALYRHADYGDGTRRGYGDSIRPGNESVASRLGYGDWTNECDRDRQALLGQGWFAQVAQATSSGRANEYRTTVSIALVEALNGTLGVEHPPSPLVNPFLNAATKALRERDNPLREATVSTSEPAQQVVTSQWEDAPF